MNRISAQRSTGAAGEAEAGFEWTPAVLAWAEAQWRDGVPAQAIGAAIGRTAQAVISRLNRAGIGAADRPGGVPAQRSDSVAARGRPGCAAPHGWTAAEDRRLLDLAAGPATAREIGAELGLGIDQVRHRLRRLGVRRDHIRGPVEAERGAPRHRRPGSAAAWGRGFEPTRPEERKPPVDCGPLDPIGSAAPIRFMDRGRYQCAAVIDADAPVLERMVCGAPVAMVDGAVSSWCAAHRRRFVGGVR